MEKSNLNAHPKENKEGGIDISNENKEFLKVSAGFLKRIGKNVF